MHLLLAVVLHNLVRLMQISIKVTIPLVPIAGVLHPILDSMHAGMHVLPKLSH